MTSRVMIRAGPEVSLQQPPHPPPTAAMPSEYEDKYLLLRDENTVLKKKKNEQEATIKRMFTKLAMIEEKLTKSRQGEAKNNQDEPETGGNKAAVVPVRRDLDAEKFIAALKSENATLRKKNQTLMEKNRWLEEQCRQSNSLKRPGAVAATTRPSTQKRPAARNAAASRTGFAGNTLEKQAGSARKLHRDTFSGELEVALKKRLVVAEKQLMKLQKENEQLRTNSSRLQLKPRRDNNEGSGLSDEEDDVSDANNKEPTNLELDQMKRELRDRQAQLAILNARYENLESNALAEREIQEKTLSQMEQMNRQVHKLRTQLQDANMEKEELEIRMMKAGDQEKDLALLREQNRRLEERMTSLCESPFINDAFQRKERIDKLFDLEKLTQEQKATIIHMTEENQKLQAAIRELQESLKQMKHAKDRVEQDLEQMAHHLMEERNARSLEAIKPTTGSVPAPRPEPLIIVRPRTPEMRQQAPEKRDACSSPVNNNASPAKNAAPSITMAGGIVSRKYRDLPPTLNFFDASGEEDNSVKHLRNRVHVLQIAHLKSMQELERCEKMLQAQTNINRELALEIEELTTSKISSSNQLQRRMKELELVCEERQQRIMTLQAEIKQLKYAREKLLLRARDVDGSRSDDSESDDETSEVASLSESLILAARDLAPGEQLVELGIVGGNFDSNVVGINSSTFVLCDFFDFESQSTPLIMGSCPEYNLSATFKVTVDGFFLRYLATEAIVLEVHQAIRGDFKLIGKSSIRLAKLLQSKGVVKEPLLTVKSTSCSNESGATVIGTLNVVLRLSTPISEVWQVHLRSYPQDLQLLSMTSKPTDLSIPKDVLCDDDIADASHITNELQITVFGCRNLRSYGKRPNSAITRLPSSYAHHQLLGFPDVFTNIVPESASPEYDLSCSRQAFVLTVDACLLRFLSKFRFWVTVFDDQAELDEGAHEDGMIGRCGLTLSDLVNGENIRGWFPLKDQNDKHAGDISVLIQWKDPFQVLQMTSSQRARGVNGRLIDVHSLDFDQQHALLSMFSSDMDGRVNYRQFLHYAAPSEELELLVAKLKERFEHAIDSELVTSVQDALTSGVDVKQRKRMHVPMRMLVRAGEKFGVFLSDAERQLLHISFGATCLATENISTNKTVSGVADGPETLIELNYLLLHVNPRLSCGERLLSHKIRQTIRSYVQEQRKRKPAMVVPALKLFEKFDDAKCGKITRSAFRKCLSALGFDLMNVESEYRELVRSHTKQPSSDDAQSDLIPVGVSLSSPAGMDLNDDVLEAVNSEGNQLSHQPKRLNCDSDKANAKAAIQRDESTRDAPEHYVTPLPASTEFQRRKQAFMDRMKAIASASSKNLVYEQMEKKLHEQRVQDKKQQAKMLPRQDLLQEHVKRLHVPQNIHHEAARTLQRQYRQYKEQQQEQVYRHSHTSIIAADLELQRILGKWTIADLSSLEDVIVNDIEHDAPDAKRTRLLTKKQFSYFLSKVSRIALPPALISQIMDYFAVKAGGMVAYRPLLHFIFSASADDKDHEKKKRLLMMDRFLLDIGLAHHTFASAGDMTNIGIISIEKFRECLARLGVRLSPKDFHLITILFDANGFEILYHALLHSLAQLPNCQQLAKAIERCHAFGIPSLREKLLACASSDDGRMSREEFLRVLMQQNAEVEQFKPEDAGMLFQMIVGVEDCTMDMPIKELCIRLEAAAKYRRIAVYDEWDKYDIYCLQRLAWNCRSLLCGSYIDLKRAFERYDWQEAGSVSLIEFVSIARRNGFTLFTENQLRGIAKMFGVKTNGSFGINYRKFLDWTTPPPAADMDAVEAKIRNFVQTKAEMLTRHLSDIIADWNQIFAAKAESRPGGINRSQFVTICKTQLGLLLDENEMRALLYTYDPQLDDRIDCNAFLRLNWREAAIARKENIVASDAAQAKGSAKETRKQKTSTVSAVSGSQALVLKTPITLLSDFLDWCDDRGVDLRGEVEAYDSTYTGFVAATELKQTLFRLGISKMDSPASAEAAIEQLVRQFRHPERADAVNYTKMLSQAAKPDWFGADSQWHDQISELLRSRVRSKANLTGKIDHSDETNYARFDAAFSHFDRERKGFLTAENIRNGLLALNYQPTPAQLGLLMTQMRIFRHDGGGLSRTEFDSFVLDPYGFRLMNKFSKQLFSDVEPRSQDTMPRVAYLSRLLMEYGGGNDASSLPAKTFWTQLERALERQVTDLEKLRLQHLFDVSRDGQIAYKLFLKAMSQWRTSVSGPVLLAESKSTEERPPVPSEKQPTAQVQRKTERAPCSRDAVLHSLYNQMSSIDFDSQLDIVEEYLREEDRKHTGSIKMKQLRRVFEQIGLSLSEDAFTSLQMYYSGIDSSSKSQEQGELVAYEKLLLALVALHEHSHDRESK